MAGLRIKRGTRAQLNAAAAASQLVAGEPYLITDEGRMALGLSASTYQAYSKEGEGVYGPAFIARSSTNTQSVATSVMTKLVTALEVEVLDTHNAWSAGTFTVPAGWAGLYAIYGMVTLTSIVDQAGVWLDVYRNGALAQRIMAARQGASSTWGGGNACLLYLTVGDTVDLRIMHNSATTTTFALEGLCAFSGNWVRP